MNEMIERAGVVEPRSHEDTKVLEPELRFGDFSGAWANKPLSKVCKMKAGKFVQASDIYEKQDFDMFPCFGGNGLRGHTRTNTHEGVYPLIGRQGALCGNVQLAKGQFHATEHAVVVDANDQNDAIWLYYQLDRLNLNRYATGQAQPGLSIDVIDKVKAYFPTKEEQQKIADFLSSVDKKIEQLTEKHRLLTEYKKGIMQQIFSQQIRFKDNNGNDYPEWEEKEVGEVFKVTRGNVLSMNLVSELVTENAQYPVYSSQTKNNGLSGFYSEFLFESCITWTTDGANAGDVKYREGKFYCTNVCGVLVSSEGYANTCISEMINRVSRKYVSYVGNPKLMNGVMAKIKISFPSVPEQQKIANVLTEVDHKINQAWSILEQTKAFKKGLLQKMFV